ncbi:hypothetical protein ACWCQK_27955 [Streptomyces sp. NPDC002306]
MAQASTGTSSVVGTNGADGGSLRVEEYGCLVLLRSADSPAPAAELQSLAATLRSAGDLTVTLLSDPRATAEPDFWPRLGGLLDSLRASGHTVVRLVMTGAGADQTGQPPPARRIADHWAIAVEAPAGPVLVAAGGSLYAPVGPDGRGGWLGFAPGAMPVRLGTRCPKPVWQSALDALPGGPVGGYALEQLPAGVLLRPGRSAATAPAADRYHAVPVDPLRLSVVADGPSGDASLWPALEVVLDSLPAQVRASTLLLVHATAVLPNGVHTPNELATRYGLGGVQLLPAPPDTDDAHRTPAAPRPGHELVPQNRSAPAAPHADHELVPYGRSTPATPPPGQEVVPYAPANAPAPAPPPPRTAAGPLAAPDLSAAWEHLGRGREPIAAPGESQAPDPPPGPDLEVAWEYLSRRPGTGADALDEPATRSGSAHPDDPAEPAVRPASTRAALRAGYRSGPAEHAALRLLAGPAWERHAPAVAHALGRLPAMADTERESVEAELTALRLYLDDADGLLDHRALAAACHGRDDRLLPFAACLVSALRRLPTHRGAVLRGAGSALPPEENPETDPLRPGTVLRDRAPLSGVAATGGEGRPRGPRYAIWSVTGRLARRLFDEPAEEVVFAPGTPFMVLDVRRSGPSPVVLLRELPASGGAPARFAAKGSHAELGEADRAALAGLDEALRGRSIPGGGGGWPERCAGPVGSGP